MNLLQKIALVQCYIHVLKNKEVQINLPRNKKEEGLLEYAYQKASDFFRNHDAIIVPII